MYERHAEQLVKLTALNKRAVQTTDRPPTLRLDQIRQEPAVFQPRSYLGENGVDRFHVSELVRPLKARGRDGQKHLEPILVFAIGNAFYCIDGHHRLAAYARLKRPLSVPVKHFEGTLSEAVAETVRRNSHDKLPMRKNDKLEAAWRLVVVDELSKQQVSSATTVATSTVANMRVVKRRLDDRADHEDPLEDDLIFVERLSWQEAKALDKGTNDKRDFDEEAQRAMAEAWAKKLGEAFGTKALRQPGIFAAAIQTYSSQLPKLLCEEWGDIAIEVAEAFADEENPDEYDE